MRRLALLPLLCLLAAAPAHGAGCSPLTCAPSQVPLSHGRLLVVRPAGAYDIARVLDLRTGKTRWRLPAGQLAGNLLVHKDGALLTWFNLATGARVADAVQQANGTFALTGTSQNGSRAVLVRNQTKRTTFAIVSPYGERVVVLGGNAWGFDALNDDRLYLLHYLRNGYEVRLYDLAHGKLLAAPLKDANESAKISGTPWVRLSSPDGRYLFTLYIGQYGSAMVHELDTQNAIARCIDLPVSTDFNTAASYSLTLSDDGRTLWAVSPGDGKVVAVDVAGAKVRDRFAFAPTTPGSPTGATSAVSRDGSQLAVALFGRVWQFDTAQHRLVRTRTHAAIALGFSPDGGTLYVVGQRSRVTALKA